ncbi:hypothetical protein LSS_16711 [Leptospira santarosai serovar Shermani str. LT 821]|uniref:Uncharacterized protein n=1 Tax=Leptospira santarosai serovar Shermani str. LT 821 TaxID=758847 RepID=K8Y770_9LEPT|nr:hypothetical protein LSS_16711 [Leptospira santarosai serovar Shermani str. LT 821]
MEFRNQFRKETHSRRNVSLSGQLFLRTSTIAVKT